MNVFSIHLFYNIKIQFFNVSICKSRLNLAKNEPVIFCHELHELALIRVIIKIKLHEFYLTLVATWNSIASKFVLILAISGFFYIFETAVFDLY
jgi:hypothetical protein